ncbi:hypothetical protein CEXT_637551 [Caerostris extrusa]|uniref:Uncharacterized protein n=1 Tax=Caerostris extrusa TaxID=172846 RepID=A0AAV4VTL6_CAEEX|nr:hypothetical protein CEXT_637551 [Caerostris extrusa]
MIKGGVEGTSEGRRAVKLNQRDPLLLLRRELNILPIDWPPPGPSPLLPPISSYVLHVNAFIQVRSDSEISSLIRYPGPLAKRSMRFICTVKSFVEVRF